MDHSLWLVHVFIMCWTCLCQHFKLTFHLSYMCMFFTFSPVSYKLRFWCLLLLNHIVLICQQYQSKLTALNIWTGYLRCSWKTLISLWPFWNFQRTMPHKCQKESTATVVRQKLRWKWNCVMIKHTWGLWNKTFLVWLICFHGKSMRKQKLKGRRRFPLFRSWKDRAIVTCSLSASSWWDGTDTGWVTKLNKSDQASRYISM